jgi:hypothetical protein
MPTVRAPRLPATRSNATTSVAGSCTRLNKSSNQRRCIFRHCSLRPPQNRCRPSPCAGLSPGSEYYGGSAPSSSFGSRCAYPGRELAAREPGAEADSSRVHCDSLSGVGAQLCPSGITMSTPQTFPMASPATAIRHPKCSGHQPATRPATATLATRSPDQWFFLVETTYRRPHPSPTTTHAIPAGQAFENALGLAGLDQEAGAVRHERPVGGDLVVQLTKSSAVLGHGEAGHHPDHLA